MGRSRGGLTTKIHALVDANGLPITVKLSEGQAHDGKSAADMLDDVGDGARHRRVEGGPIRLLSLILGDERFDHLRGSGHAAHVGRQDPSFGSLLDRCKRASKKLHLGVDRSGSIVAEVLTDGNADDSNTGLNLIDEVKGDIASFTADAAYDTTAIYDAVGERGAKVVVPPIKTATRSRRRRHLACARDCTIMRVKKIGRRRWKKESGYHRQARVENTFFRYKSIIGDRLRARHPKSQEAEALMACNILNRMITHGRPESCAIVT